MEPQTTVNVLNQTINNFSFKVVVNLFIYSSGVTLGILLAKEIANYLRIKLLTKHERMAAEIKELNNKMHDILVDLKIEIDNNSIEDKNYINIKRRLYYNSSRLKKYDRTIFQDVNNLYNKISFDSVNKKIIANHEVDDIMDLIRKKVDEVWIDKGVN